MNSKISELKVNIKEQQEENVRLFKIFEYKMHKEEMQPLIQEWREGSKHLKSMLKELQELEIKTSNLINTSNSNKTFVNGFGEATKREITNSSYQRQENRTKKEILSFIGGRYE